VLRGTIPQLHYLAHKKVKKLWIEKKNWRKLHGIHLETVEISPGVCCFEWEGEQTLKEGDELIFRFDLKENSLNIRAAIFKIYRCRFLDEGYEHKIWHFYCARFDDELDPDLFNEIIGPRRQCKSRF
jgi:hypothetical protein